MKTTKFSEESSSNLYSILNYILDRYPHARNEEEFAVNPLGKYFRNTFPTIIKALSFVNQDHYMCKGSIGIGNWSKVPWIAIFDTRITNSAQYGVYIVYLFSEDGKSVYLTLNQGSNSIMEKYSSARALDVLSNSAEAIRDNLSSGTFIANSDINTGNLAYDRGCIFFKEYHIDDLPDNRSLESDLKELVEIYTKYFEISDDLEISAEDEISNELDASYVYDDVYPMNDIKIDRGFYTVFELKRKYDQKPSRVILDSSFQRENVWSVNQQSELIESILMGLPLPIFYFNADKQGRLVVVDGRQRLTALFKYLDNEYSLKNLKILKQYNNKFFDDLGEADPALQSQIEDYQVQAHLIQPPTPDRIKFDIFDRVNRAGTQLNKQEIRNALYQGPATELLNKLVNSESFKCATGGAYDFDKRMKGRYILLRFIAIFLYVTDQLKSSLLGDYQYKNDIDDFLGYTMDFINIENKKTTSALEANVSHALNNAYFYLGEDAFRLKTNSKRRNPINMNLFEAIMYLMLNIPYEEPIIKDRIIEKVNNLGKNTDFLDSIGDHRDQWEKITKRLSIMNGIAKEVCPDYDSKYMYQIT